MRHGTTTGYRQGCREACCRRAVAAARANERKRYYLLRTDTLMVPTIGPRRRIQALAALGWSTAEVSRRAGYNRSHLGLVMQRQSVQRNTAERVAKVYNTLSMQLPPQDTKAERVDASRARRMARERGWPVPLAWTNIDDPNETPINWQYAPSDRADTLTDLDEQHAGISEACRVLNVRRETLDKWAARHGMSAVFSRMVAREQPDYERLNTGKRAS